jgi:2-alkyl-3-oxoalkanoate reductase
VGSHILDSLCARGIPVAVLLRASSSRGFIQERLREVEVRSGSICDAASLKPALAGVTHVIHCAGCTRARRNEDYYEINHLGTRNIVEALNARGGSPARLVHISSLAVTGPAPAARPAREDDAPRPVSEYGKSKLAAEGEVTAGYRGPFVVLRPPAVYGPRDNGFQAVFKAVKRHLLPRTSARQSLSLVYVKDLAEAVAACLDHPAATGRTYFVAGREVVTLGAMGREIAGQLKVWTVPVPLSPALLWPVCLFNEGWGRLTGTARLMNLQKHAELRAPGWVCDPSRLEREVGCTCPTELRRGIPETLAWYTRHGWL